MKLFFGTLLLLSISNAVFGGTLTCTTTDIATADVLSDLQTSKIEINDLIKPREFVLQNEFIESHLSLSLADDEQVLFSIISKSDVGEDKKEFFYSKSEFQKQFVLGTTSVSSASLNLDTLFTKCIWRY